MTRPADYTRAAAKACRVLLARHVAALPVDPLALLKAVRNTAVYPLEHLQNATDLPEDKLEAAFRSSDAFTCIHEDGGEPHHVIIYRTDGNPARLRFTLAHELGHIVLRHTGSDPSEEDEADCFASFLLCPEPVLRLLASAPGDAVERIAKACYVSRSCARVAFHRKPSRIPTSLQVELEIQLKQALESLKKAIPKPE